MYSWDNHKRNYTINDKTCILFQWDFKTLSLAASGMVAETGKSESWELKPVSLLLPCHFLNHLCEPVTVPVCIILWFQMLPWQL